MAHIQQFAAPRLPAAPTEYERQYADQLTNTLRLYFNQLDGVMQALTTNQGGSNLGFPYAEFQSEISQSTTANTATAITVSIQNHGNGIALLPASSSKVLVNVSGVYNLQYSVQMQNLDTAAQDASIWVRKNGVNETWSNSVFGLQARKSAGVASRLIASINYMITMLKGDYVELFWSPSIDTVTMPMYPATVGPDIPNTPSVILTLTFVSEA